MREQRKIEDIQLDFLVSALSDGRFIGTEEVLNWLREQNETVVNNVQPIPLRDLDGWQMANDKLCHASGKFFSIEGIRIRTNYRNTPEWDQPIINQPEIGFLGFITKKFNGVLHFLAQAKIEPGNLNVVQLSPTLQATRSNYTRVHGGAKPNYLEYFNGEKPVQVLVDQLQSEQGARFLHKRNRNIIVEVDEQTEVPLLPNFVWVSLKQIKELLWYPNVVNMDTRTVISCVRYGSYSEQTLHLINVLNPQTNLSHKNSYIYSVLSEQNHYHELETIIHWITALKFKYEMEVQPIGLSQTRNWIYDGNTIHHEKNKYFDVIGVRCEIGKCIPGVNRWCVLRKKVLWRLS